MADKDVEMMVKRLSGIAVQRYNGSEENKPLCLCASVPLRLYTFAPFCI
jgi:hypothetical protein